MFWKNKGQNQRMRILIISKYFPPENSIASLRPYSWAKYWAKAGNQVEVLTTIKVKNKPEAIHLSTSGFKVNEVDFRALYYSLKSVYKKNRFSKSASSETNAVDQAVIPNTNPSVRNKISGLLLMDQWRKNRGLFLTARMPDVMDLWIKPATLWARENGPWDLVVSSHGPYACHLIGLKLKKENVTKKWIADFRDLWTDNHIYNGLFPFTLAEKYLEKKIINHADLVTTVSAPLAETLKNKYPEKQIQIIQNGFDSEELNALPSGSFFRENKVRIIHTGTFYQGKMSPTLLFEAIQSLSVDTNLSPLLEKLEVIFCGPDNSIVMQQAKDMKILPWVKDGGFLSRDLILKMQSEAHVLLFLGFDKNKTAGILSGKIFEYLFSGTLIWAIDEDDSSAVGQIIKEAKAGILFGENLKLMKQELISLLKMPEKQQPTIDITYLKQFERAALADKMLKLVTA